jgi:hypothetical protein
MTPEKMDKAYLNVDAAVKNDGLTKRAALLLSREVNMIGHIHWGIFFRERYLRNEIAARIKLSE